MSETVAVDDIIVAAEIGRLLGVSQAAVSNWKHRDVGFPESFSVVGATALYRRSEILRWYCERYPQRVQAARDLVAAVDATKPPSER